MTTTSRHQVSIGSVMIAIVALAPFLALARVDLYTGLMTAAYAIPMVLLVVLGGRKAIPWVLLSLAIQATLIAAWPIARGVALEMGLKLTRPDLAGSRPSPWRLSSNVNYARRLWEWEAWSLWRWWLLFGPLTWFIAPKTENDRADAAVALLKFTPWLVVMEVGFLGGAWLAFGSFRLVPEPSTLFDIRLSPWLWRDPRPWIFWFCRGALPTFVVGLAYFRSVARWNWQRSAVGAVALIPMAVVVSIGASLAFGLFLEINLL